MDFEEITIQHFILNESFQQWAYLNDPEAAAIWVQWLQENPAKIGLVAEAEEYFASLRIKEDKPSSREFREDWLRIQPAWKYSPGKCL